MLSEEDFRKRLSYFEKECTRLSDFLYTAIQEAVELRALYYRYRHALWEKEDLMPVRLAIDRKMTLLAIDLDFSTFVLNGLKRDYQEIHDAE